MRLMSAGEKPTVTVDVMGRQTRSKAAGTNLPTTTRTVAVQLLYLDVNAGMTGCCRWRGH